MYAKEFSTWLMHPLAKVATFTLSSCLCMHNGYIAVSLPHLQVSLQDYYIWSTDVQMQADVSVSVSEENVLFN